MSRGLSLETAMKHSLDDLDGVFTYVCVTGNELGIAKDEMAAKPLVLFESDPPGGGGHRGGRHPGPGQARGHHPRSL